MISKLHLVLLHILSQCSAGVVVASGVVVVAVVVVAAAVVAVAVVAAAVVVVAQCSAGGTCVWKALAQPKMLYYAMIC